MTENKTTVVGVNGNNNHTDNIKMKIEEYKKNNDVAILAHSYQNYDVLEVSDVKGDSYALSVAATNLEAQTILMCGVRFMAETIKILSPEKKVILVDKNATCPMAEQIDVLRVVEFKKQNPDFIVMSYVNTTASLKAVSDVCVTSSSALNIVNNIKEKNILFIPDKNLGTYIKESCPDKNVVLFEGFCPIHNAVTVADCEEAKNLYPNTKMLMHPELPKEVLAYADVIGSTADILNYAKSHDENFIIGTELAIAQTLSIENPNRLYPPLSKKLICPDMKTTNISHVYQALIGLGGEEIILDEEIRLKAKRSLDNMVKYNY